MGRKDGAECGRLNKRGGWGLGPGCWIQKLIDDPKKQKNHEQGERKRMKLALGLDAHILLSVLSLPGSSPSSLGV